MLNDYRIRGLITAAPTIVNITLTELGHEFTAIDDVGVIFPEPGMLLSLTGGELPEEFAHETYSKASIQAFLSNNEFDITPWEDVDDDTLEELYHAAFDNSKLSMKEKMHHALSSEQLNNLSDAQRKLFTNRLALRLDEKGAANITPPEIQGIYEIVTEYLLSSVLETATQPK